MDNNPPPPNLLDLLRGMLDDHLGKTEFTAAFEKVITYAKDMDARFSKSFADLSDTLMAKVAEMRDSMKAGMADAKQEMMNYCMTQMQTMMAQHDAKMQAMDAKMDSVMDGAEGPMGPMGPQGPAGSPDMAEDIRNKLELLQGDERLDVSAIKGIDERIREIAPKSQPTSFVISRGAVKLYDLTDQLDGATKTFALPAFWRVISVQSSSTPNAFRPTTDYTTDASAMTITFTDQIDAGSTLAAGQTLTLIYAEA